MKKLSKFIVTTLAALLLAGTAYALPISGDIGMVGWGFGAIDTLTATAIPQPTTTMVTMPTGDFDTYLNSGDSVFYYGFTFDPAPSPVADPLWTAGGFTFVLDSVAVLFRDSNQLVLDGLGTLSGNGFDATLGTWGMTIDAQNLYFNFSNSTSAAPVPEPATMLLLGSGLIGIAGFCRKKARKKKY